MRFGEKFVHYFFILHSWVVQRSVKFNPGLSKDLSSNFLTKEQITVLKKYGLVFSKLITKLKSVLLLLKIKIRVKNLNWVSVNQPLNNVKATRMKTAKKNSLND